MTEEQDEPLLTLDNVFVWIIGFFSAVGMMATAGAIGLYYGGFFHYLAGKNPTGLLAYISGIV